jgi:hypothetical protein
MPLGSSGTRQHLFWLSGEMELVGQAGRQGAGLACLCSRGLTHTESALTLTLQGLSSVGIHTSEREPLSL